MRDKALTVVANRNTGVRVPPHAPRRIIMQFTQNEIDKFRVAFVRVAKQRALKKMQYILMTKSTKLKEYTYGELRQLNRLSEFTIKSSKWPLFLLNEACSLNLINDFESGLLFKGYEFFGELSDNASHEARDLFNRAIKEVL